MRTNNLLDLEATEAAPMHAFEAKASPFRPSGAWDGDTLVGGGNLYPSAARASSRARGERPAVACIAVAWAAASVVRPVCSAASTRSSSRPRSAGAA